MAPEARTLTPGELLPILGDVFRGHQTGTLVLQKGPTSKFLYAEEGQFIFAASNAAEDKFTEILIEKGKLTADQLAMAMEKKGNRTIGRTLVELGFLGSTDLLEALVEQMRRIAVSAANWEEGQAIFKPGVLPPNLAKLPVVTPRFILDVALSVEDRAWAARVLGDLEHIPSLTPEGQASMPALRLSEAERKVLAAVNGRSSAREVADAAGADPFTAARLLIGLSALGFLEIAPAEEPTKAEEPRIDLNFLDIATPEAPEVPGPTPSTLPPSPAAPAPLPFEAPAPAAKKEEAEEPSREGEEEALPSSLPGMSPPPPPIRVAESRPPRPPAPSFRPIRVDAGISRPELLFPEGQPDGETEPHEAPKGRPRASGRLRRLLLGAAAALAVLSVGAFSLWYFFLKPSSYVPLEPAAPAVRRPRPAAPAPSPEPEAPAPVPSPPAPAAEAPPVQPAPEPQSPTPSPAAPVPHAPPPAEASPAPPAATAPPAPAPAPVAGDAEARRLLQAGRYAEAARAFSGALRGRTAAFTVDVEVACQPETIAKGLQAAGGDERFMVLPYDLKGRSCFRVIWGLYPDRPSAEAALAELPAFFKQNASPRVAAWKRP